MSDHDNRKHALERANRERAERQARGEPLPKPKSIFERHRLNPRSLALALKAYYLDMEGALHGSSGPDFPYKEQRAIAMAAYAAGRKRGLRPTINQTCLWCVHATDDPGGVQRVRECACTDCPLHAVRPYQKDRGKTAESGNVGGP